MSSHCVPEPLESLPELVRLNGSNNASVWKSGGSVFRCHRVSDEGDPRVDLVVSLMRADLARDLRRHGIHVPSPLQDPYLCERWVVETWEFIEQVVVDPITAGLLLGVTVRALHSVPISEVGSPESLDPGHVVADIEQLEHPWVDEDLVNDVRRAAMSLPQGGTDVVVHGDLWLRNVITTSTRAYLVDLDSLCVSDPISDLALIVLGPLVVRGGNVPAPIALDAFEQAYGEALPSVADAAAFAIVREASGLVPMALAGKSLADRTTRIRNLSRLVG